MNQAIKVTVEFFIKVNTDGECREIRCNVLEPFEVFFVGDEIRAMMGVVSPIGGIRVFTHALQPAKGIANNHDGQHIFFNVVFHIRCRVIVFVDGHAVFAPRHLP